MVLLADSENLLHLGHLLVVGIVDLVRVKSFHLLLCNKAALVAVSLLCQVLTTVVSHLLFGRAQLLLVPVVSDLQQQKGIFRLFPAQSA